MAGHVPIERWGVDEGVDRDERLGCPRGGAHDLRASGSRADETEEHSKGGRLAGAVRPEEPVDLAAVHVQVERVDRDDAGAVALGQPVCLDHLLSTDVGEKRASHGSLGDVCGVRGGADHTADHRSRAAIAKPATGAMGLADDAIEIRGVTDSAQAERVFTEFEPDCVLLDLHMPEPDGLEILRRIRDVRSRLGFLPVLVLTSDIGPVARSNALDLGADDFLTKPLDRQAVVLRVRNLLSTRRLHVDLARASRHKSEFLASMSHELRTQLSSVIGFSELLLSDTSDRFDDARRRKFLAQINSSGRYLLDLTSDILDLAKIDSGRAVLRLEIVMIVELAHGVIRSLDPLAAKKAIRIKAELAAPGQVRADAGKLRQMLLNLVSNAIKFTPEGGLVTIGAERFADRIEISVSDTGIGIPESEFEHLFDEFRQFDSDTAREQRGTGLGLALTKRFVELHGGRIRVASEVGKGSVFTLSLPLATRGEGLSSLSLALQNVSMLPSNR